MPQERELTEAEVDALFENGQFGVQDPKSLQRAHGVPDKMEVIKERLNRKRTQATRSRDAQLNFTNLLEVTIPKRC